MAYYVRLFSKSRQRVAVSELVNAVFQINKVTPVLEVESGTEAEWNEVMALAPAGQWLCLIERNEKDAEDSLFEQEVEEFTDELRGAAPAQGAGWVADYLGDCTTVYAARVFEAAGQHQAYLPTDILWALKSLVGGILQADGEGWSDENGHPVVSGVDTDANELVAEHHR